MPRATVTSIPVDVPTLVSRGHTAVVTVEVQDGVVGEHSLLPELAAAAAGILPNIAALCRAARTAGVPVVHCTADSRPDGLGGNRNARLFGAMRKLLDGGPPGPPRGVQVHAAVGVDPADLVLPRLHGVSPMTSTSLDPVLRNLGVTTIVATGVSLNVAVLGLLFESVNLGYQVVVPRDAVAGVDADYVDALLRNTVSLLATVTTTEEVVDAWSNY